MTPHFSCLPHQSYTKAQSTPAFYHPPRITLLSPSMTDIRVTANLHSFASDLQHEVPTHGLSSNTWHSIFLNLPETSSSLGVPAFTHSRIFPSSFADCSFSVTCSGVSWFFLIAWCYSAPALDPETSPLATLILPVISSICWLLQI